MKRVGGRVRCWGSGILAAWMALIFAGCDRDRSSHGGRIELVLDYLPNPIHAGLYYAQTHGFFGEAGLSVAITAPTSTTDSLRLVAAGRADVGFAPLMDYFQAVADGQDLVLLLALVDRPLAAVMVREETGVTRPRELEGRTVGLTGVPSDGLTLDAMVRHDGGDPGQVEKVTIGFNAAQVLVGRRVDAAFGFWSYEGVIAERSVALRYFRPDAYGIPNYPEIVAFARRSWAEENLARVQALREAITSGYRAARGQESHAALAPLAEVLEGERPAELVPFWEILLPVLPASDGFSGEVRAEEIRRYLDWIMEQGFLSIDRPSIELIFDRSDATG